MHSLVVILSLLVAADMPSPKDEYLYLFSKFDTDGFAPPRAADQGDFDGGGSTFPDEILPAGKRLEVLSSGYGKVVFLRPRTESGAKNMLSLRGQTIRVRTKNTFNVLLSLGVAHDSPTNARNAPNAAAGSTANHGWIEFTFADGTTGRGPIGFSLWDGEPTLGEDVAFTAKFTAARRTRPTAVRPLVRGRAVPTVPTTVRRVRSGAPIRIWVQRTPIPANKVVTSIKLPDLPHLKIVGLTLANRVGISPRRTVQRLSPEPAPVAIFDEPGFPYSMSAESATPERIQEALASAGIASRRIGIDHLRDSQVFNVERFPVTVMPHGDTFPLSALDAIRAYRKSGGAMVLSGSPFTRAVEQTPYGGWRQQSLSTEFTRFTGDRALGAYPRSTVTRTRVWPSETLAAWGFADLPWNRLELRDIHGLEFSYQGLDTRSEFEGVEIEPLLNVGSWATAVAAIVRQTSGEFAGGLDVYTATGPMWIDDARVATRLHIEFLARGAAWCLKEKGKLSDDAWKAIARPLDAKSLDQVGPEIGAPLPQPFELLPAKKLDGTVYWVDMSMMSPEERMLLASAQGLIHRRDKHAVFLAESSRAEAWLKTLADEKLIGTAKKSSAVAILGMLENRRAVIVDPDLYGSLNLATMIGALEGLLVAYPGHVERYDLEVASDLRGTFDSHADALDWAVANIRPLMRSDILSCMPAKASTWRLRDFLVREKVFTFDIPPVDRASDRVEVGRSREIAKRLLLGTPLLTPVLGAADPAPSVTQNDPASLLAIRSGKRYVDAGEITNLSFYRKLDNRLPRSTKIKPRSLALDTSKVYLAVLGEPLSLDVALALERTLSSPGTRVTGSSVNALALRRAQAFVRRNQTRPKTAPTPPYLPASVAAEIGVHGLVARPVITQALNGSPATGVLLPRSFTPDGFGKVFGARRSAAVESLFRAVGERMKSRRAKFLQVAVHTAFKPADWTAGIRQLPTDAGVFVAYDSRRANEIDALTSSRLVGENPVFHDLGIVGLRALLTADGLEPYRKLFPLFLSTDMRALATLERAGAISDDVIVVRPEEIVALAKEYYRHRELTTLDVLPRGAKWRYHDKGEDLGTRWRALSYDDSAWSEGPSELGYGDANEGRPEATVLSYGEDANKRHPCYYFRRSVTLENAPNVELLLLELIADDGAIVYINGKEVYRFNMPEGDVKYASYTPKAYGGATEADWRKHPIATDALHVGKNAIAVEVHQCNASSTDMSFDLKITGWQVKR
jgi:hypothetical protein